jgi:predicted HTH transcriptional regulator
LDDIDIIIKEGEGQFVEFKRSLTDLGSEMTAFANASGGGIYIEQIKQAAGQS